MAKTTKRTKVTKAAKPKATKSRPAKISKPNTSKTKNTNVKVKAKAKVTTKVKTTTTARKSTVDKAKTKPSANTATRKRADRGEVTVDRRGGKGRRGQPDQRVKNQPTAVERRAAPRRAKVARRRQIDPTTCERDYTLEEIEFMSALSEYKRTSGRMFPTCSEILEVVQKLGYAKVPVVEPLLPQETTSLPVVDIPSETSLEHVPMPTTV